MIFSDWITIISILIAVLLAVFKFDEWEIIKLKERKPIYLFPLLFFIISGMTSYYNSNPHPEFLNFLWNNKGLQSGLWPIILMVILIISIYYSWKKLTHSKPSKKLVEKYSDYLSIYEPVKFSSLFRKYEKYIFNKNDKHTFRLYEKLFTHEKFWLIGSTHLKKIISKEPEKFYNVNINILKTLLSSQLSNIPNSIISQELERQWNGVQLSEDTPILNVFLYNSNFIEKSIDRNILLSTIKYESNEYFSSLKFLKNDKEILSLNPSDNAFHQVIPKKLVPFYYIQLIDCYWHQVIATKSIGHTWFAYSTWTKYVLHEAPSMVKNDFSSDNLPNHYVLAIDQMLSNIHNWVNKINNGHSNQSNYIQSFNELKIEILLEIQKNFLEKVSEIWFIEKEESLLNEIIIAKNLLKKNYDENSIKNLLQLENLKLTFEKLTDRNFYSKNEKENYGYKWLSALLNN